MMQKILPHGIYVYSVVMFVGRCVHVGVWHNNNTMCACACVYACNVK